MDSGWAAFLGAIAGGLITGGATFGIEFWRKKQEDERQKRDLFQQGVRELQEELARALASIFDYLNARDEGVEIAPFRSASQRSLVRVEALLPWVNKPDADRTARAIIGTVNEIREPEALTNEQKLAFDKRLRGEFLVAQNVLGNLLRSK